MNMNMSEENQKLVVKGYFRYLVAVYAIYMVFLYMVMKGDSILEWFGDKIDWIKRKFRRKEETEEI